MRNLRLRNFYRIIKFIYQTKFSEEYIREISVSNVGEHRQKYLEVLKQALLT